MTAKWLCFNETMNASSRKTWIIAGDDAALVAFLMVASALNAVILDPYL